jgi:SP family galactose:H+ symporter-like MFS transporter
MSTSPSTKKVSPIVYFIGFTAALAGLLFGLDVGVISGAQIYIQRDLGVNDQMIEWIVSALLWGAVVGALGSGILCKKLGRRGTLLASGLLFAVGAFFCAAAPNAHILIIARLVLGLAVGIASFTAPLYLAEIAPQSVRGGMISMYQLMITIGILMAFLSDTFFASLADGQIPLPKPNHGAGDLDAIHLESFVLTMATSNEAWRLMLGMIALPALVMFFGVLFLPESPRWLVLNGMKEKASAVFKKLHLDEAEIAAEIREIEESTKIPQKGWSLFLENAHFRKAVFLGVGLQIVQQLTGINVIMYYAPRIIGMANDAVTYGRARKRRRRLEKARKVAEAERQKAALSQAAMALPSTSASARYNELLSPTSSSGASPRSAPRRGGNGFAFSISEASSSHVWASFGSVSQGQRPEVK